MVATPKRVCLLAVTTLIMRRPLNQPSKEDFAPLPSRVVIPVITEISHQVALLGFITSQFFNHSCPHGSPNAISTASCERWGLLRTIQDNNRAAMGNGAHAPKWGFRGVDEMSWGFLNHIVILLFQSLG
ncbi:hypothetical protein JTE90_024362 [Oedothorax gibbosus]|uniref:Uncharacterized protein n=1 Tax=Oedothorax gibbosus TaxID=931172 RepID=A0AAV6VXW2_9ARAC|nr:hypothetical protein JTE90_024362 [Oedothorax gibbosus]